jgi:hypothetical protein
VDVMELAPGVCPACRWCPAIEVHKMNFRDKQATNYLNLM